MPYPRQSTVWRYFLAIASVGVAWWLRQLLDPVLGDRVPHATFFVAVVFSAWLGGRGPSIAALLLGMVAAWYSFVSPRGTFALQNAEQAISLAMYLFVGISIVTLSELLGGEGRLRRQAEVEAAEQREWFRVSLASIGDAVIATDTQGRVTYLNAVAERLTGWPQAEAVGRPLPEVFRIVHEDTRAEVENPALRTLREGVVVGLANHTLLIARDGVERPIDDSAAPIRDDRGR